MTVKRCLVFLFFFCFFSATVVASRHDMYNGYKVYKFKTTDASIMEQLSKAVELDFWQEPTLQRDGIVMVKPGDQNFFENHLEQAHIEYNLLSENVKELLDDHDSEVAEYRSTLVRNVDFLQNQVDLDRYYRYDEITNFITNLANTYADIVEIVDAGNSFEGRSIKYVKISTSNFATSNKPVVMLDAAIHAREWISPPVALYILQQLVVDNAAPDLLNDFDWIILPVVNPDGYEFTHTDDRLWRKTRSTKHEGGLECPGVDGNRNYDFFWMSVGASNDPCSTTYAGPSPFSEPEVQIVNNIMMGHLDRIQLYISLHSYGSLLLYPWGHNGTAPDNEDDLHRIGKAIADTIDKDKLPEAAEYMVGNSANTLYLTSGASKDYARLIGIPLSYTLELPSIGYGFELPPSYVDKVVRETWAGIATGVRTLNSL